MTHGTNLFLKIDYPRVESESVRVRVVSVLCKRIYGVGTGGQASRQRRENRVTRGDRPKRIIRFRDERRNETPPRTVPVCAHENPRRRRMIYQRGTTTNNVCESERKPRRITLENREELKSMTEETKFRGEGSCLPIARE